ncbi:MAG TPA: toprim domain-containing protein [Steroidobacteraceae bacterium]|nr:toprim domain-containing protein [Steroidobacteraceae bacterium]
MARIPDAELERLKCEVSLVRLIEGQGHRLISQGKDLACRCPWHEGDETPSCIVTPKSNLWHCFGCDAGGTVIDWVMRSHRVSFRHACELLLKQHPTLAASAAGNGAVGVAPKLSPGKLRQAQSFSLKSNTDEAASDQRLLGEVIEFYHETLLGSPEALKYLEARGLGSRELIEHFRLGFANRTLAYRLAPKQYKAGAELRSALQRVGILRESGHEHFNGSLVIPVINDAGEVTEVYGRKIRDDLRPGTPCHLYLPGPHRGVWNASAAHGSPADGSPKEVILCEALIDALTYWAAGFRNVTASYGVEGFTAEHLELFKKCGIERVFIAYDRDEAGDRAAERLSQQLMAEGLECCRVLFPHGMDANEYALKVQPPAKSLGLALRSAHWMGKGAKPKGVPLSSSESIPPESSTPAPRTDTTVIIEPSVTDPPSVMAAVAVPLEAPVMSPQPVPPNSLESLEVCPPQGVPLEVRAHEVLIVLGDRRWRIRGLSPEMTPGQLKVNLLVSREEAFHVDTLDLYIARARAAYISQAAAELALPEEALKRDLGAVLLRLEALQAEKLESKPAAPVLTMTAEEKSAALALLTDPNLPHRIVADLTLCGVVGEETNKLIAYLACLSRKQEKPLAVVVQSTSAAGKSTLMEAVLALMPPEERVHYSAMTGQSLFYMGEIGLKHKILAIAEEQGVQEASYALKLLQSQGELTIASTGKDPVSGRLVTHEYQVEGPVMLFLTTTAIEVDEELLNRCLVLTVNESREQTRAIHQLQRKRRTLAGLIEREQRQGRVKIHQNAQRLLRPLPVVNPYAEQLSFLDGAARTRRDHEKYLSLIESIALLHQYQREVKTAETVNGVIEYVEVTLDDIQLANELASRVLGHCLDELPPQTRRLLSVILEMVEQECRAQQVSRAQYRFSRRQVREYSGFGHTQLRLHLERLVAMEYLLVHRGTRGASFVYELVYGPADGSAAHGIPQSTQPPETNTAGHRSPHLPGLIDVEELRSATTTPPLAGGVRGQSGPVAGVPPHAEKPAKEGTCAELAGSTPVQGAAERGNGALHRTVTSSTSSSLAASSSVPS